MKKKIRIERAESPRCFLTVRSGRWTYRQAGIFRMNGKCAGLLLGAGLLLSAAAAALCGCAKEQEPLFSVQEDLPEEESTASEMPEESSSGNDSDASRQSSENNSSDPENVREETPEHRICVHVTGAVRHPGVYELPEGARIIDAADAAGGLTEEADRVWVNQAAVLTDGMQIYFPTREETADYERNAADLLSGTYTSGAADSEKGEMGGSSASGGRVNINTADRETLMTLHGIGEAKAEAIIAYREEHGGFRSIEEIREVNGIKDSVFAKIRESISVE